jgi:hypothetical protein
MSRAAHICDAPGCDARIRRAHLMCRDHWYATPRHLREAIAEAWATGRIRDWSALCLEARGFHAQHPEPVDEAIAAKSLALHHRIIGEGADA